MNSVRSLPRGRGHAPRREPAAGDGRATEVQMSVRKSAVLLLLVLSGCAWTGECPPGTRRATAHELGASPRRVDQINSTSSPVER